MPEKEKVTGSGISRRQFIKGAGIVIGGTAVGTSVLLSACGGGETTTVTRTNTTTATTTVTLNINGKARVIQVEPEWSLAFVLREKLGLTGTKVGCDRGECGTCTVLVDGVAMYACMMFANECEGMAITTIEGLADGATLHPVQQAFFDRACFQCGYCTPGNIMSAVALLSKNANPTRSEVKEALAGNLCYCVDYTRIVNTILAAAGGS
jgi:xanthine dehydrogenase YagT iron-sulfur-binding subunit